MSEYDLLIDGESMVAVVGVSERLPTMHVAANGSTARCGAMLLAGTSRLRYDHARLFSRPCAECFRGVGLRPGS